jgi:hypothetical protein
MPGLQKNVASQNMTFCMLSATTGGADTSATVTVYVTKDNGTQATGSGTVTNSGHGQYNYAPTQAETNATDVGFLFTASGDIPVNLDFHTDVCDSNGNPAANLVDIAGSAVSTSSAQLGVNLVNIAGSAVSTTTAQLGVNAVQYNAQTTQTDSNGLPKVDLVDIAGSAVSTSSAQLGVNVVNIGGHGVTLDANNLLEVDVQDISGSAVSTSSAQIGVNVVNINAVSASPVTTVNANQGTTQPINFTGTGSSAFVKSDMQDIAGSAVSTSTAQIGSNLVNIAGSAVSTSTAQLGVNLVNIAGSAVSTSTAQVGANVVSVAGAASNIKKNQALTGFEFLMTNSTSHNPQTGLTVTSTVSHDGGSFGSTTNSVTEIANGWYTLNLSASDMNGNNVALRFTASGADDRDILIVTQP